MIPRELKRVFQEVRDFYAAGVKSNNKVYARDDFVDRDDWDDHRQKWSVRLMAGNLFRSRNSNRELSAQNRPAPPIAGQTFPGWGRIIYNGGARAQFTSGNCMEMAAVCMALAIDPPCSYPDAAVYLGAITPPGDHAFCLISMTTPRWASASAMVRGSGNPAALVLDPWLNTLCAAEDYWENAQAKVRKWGRDGKRIAWNGNLGRGWYNPSGAYATAFGGAPLRFIGATDQL